MLRCQDGSTWPSIVTRLYRPSLPACVQVYILYRLRDVYRFYLVVLLLLVHVKGSDFLSVVKCVCLLIYSY